VCAQKHEGEGPNPAQVGDGQKPRVSTGLARIAELAKQDPKLAFTSLAHYVTKDSLYEAFEWLNARSAAGVDGQSVKEYAENLDENLDGLLKRFRSDTYKAPPVRRVHIPKGTGPETRPIGIPTVEDKILQRAVSTVLEAIYEQDFSPCSYGFRRGRGAHDALNALWKQSTNFAGGWVVEVDIRKFFDTLDHQRLRELLQIRVRDGVICRMINRWLKAGVLEDGSISLPTQGTPQGGVISPLLANVYLHYVLDLWFEHEVQPKLQGRAYLVRYADDFVMGFTVEADARQVMAWLPERFAAYGLQIHPDKTKLVDFRHPLAARRKDDGDGLPTSFDFLAFNHHWERTYKKKWVIRQKTAKSRFQRGMDKVVAWCRANRHLPIPLQAEALSRKLQGHYAYFGLTGNYARLWEFFRAVTRTWHAWLNRRSQRRKMTWERFRQLLERHPLPRPRVVHSIYARTANTHS
jgi:group II intron reverse transcriptase/maturase